MFLMSGIETLPPVCFECTDEMVPADEEALRNFVRVRLEDKTSDFRVLIERLLQHHNKANQTEVTVNEALDISNGGSVKSLAEVRTVNEVVRKAVQLVRVQLPAAAAGEVFLHRNVPSLDLVRTFASSECLLQLSPLINSFLGQEDKLNWLKALPQGTELGTAGAFMTKLMASVYQGDTLFSDWLFSANVNVISPNTFTKIKNGQTSFAALQDWQVESLVNFVTGFTHLKSQPS